MSTYTEYMVDFVEVGQRGNMDRYDLDEGNKDYRAHKHTVKNFFKIKDSGLPLPKTKFERQVYDLVQNVNNRNDFCASVGETKLLGHMMLEVDSEFMRFLLNGRIAISKEFYDKTFVCTVIPIIEVRVNIYGMQLSQLVWEDGFKTPFCILDVVESMIHVPYDEINCDCGVEVYDTYEEMMNCHCR